MTDVCKEEKDEIIVLAGEYLGLCRRWRGSGPALGGEEIERLVQLRTLLEGVLGSRPPVGGPRATRRKGIRVPIQLDIRYDTGGATPQRGHLIEVAEEGVFIATGAPAEVGTRVSIELPGNAEGVEGVVVRVRTPGDPSGRPGMAVHLSNMTPAQCGTMLDLVEGALTVRLARRD